MADDRRPQPPKRRVPVAVLVALAAVAAASAAATVAGMNDAAPPREQHRPASRTWPADPGPGGSRLPSADRTDPTNPCPGADDAHVQAEPFAVPTLKDQPPKPPTGPTICLAAGAGPDR